MLSIKYYKFLEMNIKYLRSLSKLWGFSGDSVVKNPPVRRQEFDPLVGKVPW